MANKVIKNSICRSKSLTRCSFMAELNFHRFLFLTDDWGCFEIDIEVIRGVLYSKRLGKVKIKDIIKWLKEYHDNGMLFRWNEKEKEYGYFINYDGHSGEFLSRKHKRKTPEPPQQEMSRYIEETSKKFNSLQKTSKDFKSSPNPNPNPNLNPKHNHKDGSISEFLDYFNLKTKKKLTLTDMRKKIIEQRLKTHTLEQLKRAVDNFIEDTWADRHKFIDVVYCIGVRKGIDNLDKWLNVEPKTKDWTQV